MMGIRKVFSRLWQKVIHPTARPNTARRQLFDSGKYYEDHLTINYDQPLTASRNVHISRHLEARGIELSSSETKLLSSFDFEAMDRPFSRRQFAVLTALFTRPTSQTQQEKISLSHILEGLGVAEFEVKSIAMSYLGSGDNKSVYRFDVHTLSGSRRSFVVSLDNVTRWFMEKHAFLEYKFLSRVRRKGLHSEALPNLLGFTVVKGLIDDEAKRYCLIFKEYIEGETAGQLLPQLDPQTRKKAVYQMGFELARLILRLGGYPNDLHYENIILDISSAGKISVVFNDIPGLIKNTRSAALNLFAEFFIQEIGADQGSFLHGFANGYGGGKRGLRLLDKFFRIMMYHPLVLCGNDDRSIEKYQEFRKQYLSQVVVPFQRPS